MSQQNYPWNEDNSFISGDYAWSQLRVHREVYKTTSWNEDISFNQDAIHGPSLYKRVPWNEDTIHGPIYVHVEKWTKLPLKWGRLFQECQPLIVLP